MKPFLAWPGSKAKCAAAILEEFPKECSTYFEPFMGSGAMFFAMSAPFGKLNVNFKHAVLSDVNEKLVNCWKSVMERPDSTERQLAFYLGQNSETFYLANRGNMWSGPMFIYMMRAGFSSMYRENKTGEFNVPWRKKDFETLKRPCDYNFDNFRMCVKFLQRTKPDVYASEWFTAIERAKAGDLVYFDPPYLPYSETGFVNYSSGGFGAGDHVMLEKACRTLQSKGVYVVLSNSDTPASRRIYGDPSKVISVSNAVKAKATTKGKRPEGLWIYKP